MSALIPKSGLVRQLARLAEPDEQITTDQVQDPERLTRILMSVLRDVASMKRRWWPRRFDFEDITVDATGTTVYRFSHGFAGRVRWWVVDWNGSAAPALASDASTSNQVLALVSHVAGTLTLRVEEAG